MIETARCLGRKWSLYHAGVLILLYAELMILALALFFCLYPSENSPPIYLRLPSVHAIRVR